MTWAAAAKKSLAGLLLAAPAAVAAAQTPDCGDAAPCLVSVDGTTVGEYRIRQPKDASPDDAPRPAVLFIHGWRGVAANVIARRDLRRFADEVGAVLIAPQSLGAAWSYPGSPAQRRDEFAYFEALRRDVVARRGVDPDRILVSGFSMGGSMAWNLACRHGDRYAAFVPFAGAFWTPLPERCENPARVLLHMHGTADRTVPIEGRPIGAGFRQGDVWESLAVLRGRRDFRRDGARSFRDERGLLCDRWSDPEGGPGVGAGFGAGGGLLEFCRHGGGHVWRVTWLRDAWRRLKQAETF